jgi:hypothetical protein
MVAQYVVYNAILRRFPADLHQRFKAAGNYFPTTIFVLASAVQKLARATRLPPATTLYRGVRDDASLPELFYKCDRRGCSGFTELAFMSTTTNMAVALSYSRRAGSELSGVVLAMHAGAVDRGASVREFSQFASEDEFLFVPHSFVSAAGAQYVEVTGSGVVRVLPVKVNANLKARTVEEQLALKKDMHLTAFQHRLHEIEQDLVARSAGEAAQARLGRDRSADAGFTTTGFAARILDQCRDVLARHKAAGMDEYVSDRAYRDLVLEMIDVRRLALAKFDEWLDNGLSFIRFHWNIPLKEGYRLWTVLLTRRLCECGPGPARREAALDVCKARGLVVDCVHEINDMGETRLMCAAAEGWGGTTLRLLVDAGAEVNHARSDGVGAVWLAAQFGHAKCVAVLAELGASVNQTACSGASGGARATPLYIAARYGQTECIRLLAHLRGDVNQCGTEGSYPLHQAAYYGHSDAIGALVELGADINQADGKRFTPLDVAVASGHAECARFIRDRGGQEAGDDPEAAEGGPEEGGPDRDLVVSSGGFLALAEYGKAGADVLVVVNYPAYVGIGEDQDEGGYAAANPGLGYRYSAGQVLARVPPASALGALLRRYGGADGAGVRAMRVVTDLTVSIARWKFG